MTFALTLSILGLVLLTLSLATIILYASGDRTDELSADDPQALGIGGGADFFEHGQPTTERSRYDHQ